MKKLIILLFIILMFVGCSTYTCDDEEDSVETKTEETKPEEKTEETTKEEENVGPKSFEESVDLSYLADFYSFTDEEKTKDFNTIRKEWAQLVLNKREYYFSVSVNNDKLKSDIVSYITSNFSEEYYTSRIYTIKYLDLEKVYSTSQVQENFEFTMVIIFEDGITKHLLLRKR